MESAPALAAWNGVMMPLAEVRIPVLDRGYFFGDAVYEVLRVYEGRPWLLKEHQQRLQRSLRELEIEADVSGIPEIIGRLITLSQLDHASIYIQISRGEAPRMHVPPAGTKPNILVYIQEVPKSYGEQRARGVRAQLCPDLRWGRCDIKTTNLLGNIMAARSARTAGFEEAILFDRDKRITEGTHTSFFAVKDNILITTPTTANILPGITRDFVLGVAKNNHMVFEERFVLIDELPQLSEVFLSGTLSEILPIVGIDQLQIGDGRVGPVTKQMGAAYEAAWIKGA